MLNPELQKFIKAHVDIGIDEFTLRTVLKNNNLSDEEINESIDYSRTIRQPQVQNSQQVTIQSSPNQQPLQTLLNHEPIPTELGDNTLEPEKPSKLLKFLCVVLTLNGVVYFLSAAAIFGLILILSSVVLFESGFGFYILKYTPTVGLIPIMLSIVALLYMYAASKVLDSSKKGFWLSVLTLVIVPVAVGVLISYLISPLYLKILGTQAGLNKNETAYGFLNFSNYSNYISIVNVVALVWMLVKRKAFAFPEEQISGRKKLFMGAFTSLVILPLIIITSFGYYQAINTDYGYSKAQKNVQYKLYKPSSLPVGRKYTKVFSNNEQLIGRKDAVSVWFDTDVPMSEPDKVKTQKPIIMRQVEPGEDFDFKQYISEQGKSKDGEQIILPQKVDIRNAKDGKGYYFVNTKSEVNPSVLYLITKDNVFIVINGINVSKNELIDFANSLV